MATRAKAAAITLPRGTLAKVTLGSSFAEYDRILSKEGAFVETPAIRAALGPSKDKCFFVGRRGTGKTAITHYLTNKSKGHTIQVLPQIFSALGEHFDAGMLADLHQQHFKSLVVCFKRAMMGEIVRLWVARGLYSFRHAPPPLSRERNLIESSDFDARLLSLTEDLLDLLKNKQQREWLREINAAKDICAALNDIREGPNWDASVLIDRIDESWDGSDEAVVLLAALMHACVEITASSSCLRPLLFLRENMFERVRSIDVEFARLETFVVSLDWSRELLLELVERRLNLNLTAKFPLHGPTWDAFFEGIEGRSSQSFVFDYCHSRPRDILTYCSLAIESAQSRAYHHVAIEDLLRARRRFSESRLKDLGDEYAENYPQIQLVLARFFGLGREFTIGGVTAFIQKLLIDEEIKKYCGKWIFRYTAPDRFIHLLYEIGFWGLKTDGHILFRSTGPQSPVAPPLSSASTVAVHPSYVDALTLQDLVIRGLDEGTELRMSGLLTHVPDSINLEDYEQRLSDILDELRTLPTGQDHAGRYEELVGEVIRLCFFRSLTNVQPHVRNIEGRVVRDWIAANHSTGGFWELVRLRYQATQVIWECKNFEDLDAAAFHQAAYYMNEDIGRLVLLSFRGAIRDHYYDHIRRISNDKHGALVLLLTDKDLAVFLRQAMNGKSRESHLEGIFDRTLRLIS